MPKIAVDEFGNKKIRKILGGRASIICYEKEPELWQYRQLKVGTKLYKYRKLNEPDLAIAARRGEDLYFDIIEEENPKNALIEDLIDQWISIKEKRQSNGKITIATVRGIRTSLRSIIQVYLKNEKKLTKISDIKSETFLDFNEWRINKSWKIIDNSKINTFPKISTVRKDLVRLKEWYKNFLIPNGYAKEVPSISPIIIKQDQSDPNPPISLKDDWPLIYNYFDKYSKEINNNKKIRTIYFRQMMREFVFVSYKSGTRPKELLGLIEKGVVINKNGDFTLNESIKGGLRWCDVELNPHYNETAKSKKNDFSEAVLYIIDSRTDTTRKITTNIGDSFIKWRAYSDKFRNENGLVKITDKDYIFINPFTSRPYPYSQISRVWDQMRVNLSHLLKGSKPDQPYTLYSLRSSYITNQINEGKDIYLIRKLTGNSYDFLQRYYDRLNFK